MDKNAFVLNVEVPDDLKAKMDALPEVDWSKVAELDFRRKLLVLEFDAQVKRSIDLKPFLNKEGRSVKDLSELQMALRQDENWGKNPTLPGRIRNIKKARI